MVQAAPYLDTNPGCHTSRSHLDEHCSNKFVEILRRWPCLWHFDAAVSYTVCWPLLTFRYGNLDKLIHHVNKDGRVRVLYSTPEVYTEHKKAEDAVRWPTKTDDFMTIAQDWSEESGLRGHMYWAGYYTSRPLLKRFAREQSSHLQAAKQLQAIARLPLRKHLSSFPELMSYKHWPSSTDLTPLKAAVGLLTHHDAVTGTPKQHVAYDYARHLDTGVFQGVMCCRGCAAASVVMRVGQEPPYNARR